MSCKLLLDSRRVGVLMLAAVAAALIGGPPPVHAASGYWNYEGFQISPTNEYYATVKPLPGRVHELKATPGFQAGPGNGKGALELFFKTDDADRVQYLCTSTLTFGADATLQTLVAKQKVMFDVSIVVDGNDKCRAIQAYGIGHIAITSDYLVEARAEFGRTASARAEATIPPGSARDTMVILVASHLSQFGAMNEEMRLNYAWVEGTPPLADSPPAAPRFGAVLGDILSVREVAGGDVYDGTWTRRAGTDVFDAVWNGAIRDVIEIESVEGNQIVLYRHGNNGRYTGTLSADGSQVTSGTTDWYATDWFWSATVSDR